MQKTCSKCGEAKNISEFYKQAECLFGVRPSCKSCDKERSADYRKREPEKARAAVARWKSENPERKRELDSKWNTENRDKVRDRSARMRAENPDKIREYARNWARKKRADPKFRIESAMKANVRGHLKRGSKFGKRTFEILGYTAEDLRDHLEKKFSDGMSWENYGRGGWHVDHIIPLASFSFETPECPNFKMAWALSNLQPLWESENCSKRDRLDHPSQISLLTANENTDAAREAA